MENTCNMEVAENETLLLVNRMMNSLDLKTVTFNQFFKAFEEIHRSIANLIGGGFQRDTILRNLKEIDGREGRNTKQEILISAQNLSRLLDFLVEKGNQTKKFRIKINPAKVLERLGENLYSERRFAEMRYSVR